MYNPTAAGVKIGLSVHSLIDPRWQRDVDEFRERFSKAGTTLLFENASSGPARQVQQCEKMMKEGAQVVLVIPQDAAAAAPIVEMGNTRKIPVIAYDRMILNCDLPLYIAYDTAKIGEMIARYALQHAPRGQYIAIDGDQNDHNAVLLREARKRVLGPAVQSGQVEVAFENWTESWRSSRAWQLMGEALKQVPNPAAVLCSADILAEGALQAISEAKLTTPVVVTGQNADLNAVIRILRGTQSMTIYKPVGPVVQRAVDAAIALARGRTSGASRTVSNGKRPVPSILLDNLVMVDKNNVVEALTGPNGSFTLQQICSKLPRHLWPPQAAAAGLR